MPQREAPPSFEDELQAAIFESNMIQQACGSAPRRQGRGDLEEQRQIAMAMAATAPFPRIPAAANTDTVTLSPAQSDASVYVSGLDDASVYVSGLDMRLIDEEELRLHMGKLGGEIMGVRMNSSKRKAALLQTAVVTYLDRVSAEQACQYLNESTVYTLSLENFTIKVVPLNAELERNKDSSIVRADATPKDDGLKVFASWRMSDEPWSEADVRAALAPHAKVRYLFMSPDIRHKPFANVWLEEDVSPELTRCVESGIPLDVIGWQLWLQPWDEPKRGFKWLPTESHSQRPSATAAEADQRPVQRPWTSSEGLAAEADQRPLQRPWTSSEALAVSHAVSNAVLVSKLPFEATVEEVRVHCMVAGAVSSARRLPRNSSLKMGDRMVIEYDEPQVAQTAASQLHHSWLPSTERYHGRHIAVEPYSMDRGEHEERPAADHFNGLGVVRTQAARVQPRSIEAFASSRDPRLGDSLDSAISGNQRQSAAISGNQSRTSQSSSVNTDVPATRAAPNCEHPSAFRDFPRTQTLSDDEMSVIKGTKLMLTGEAGTFALLSRVSKHLKTSVDTQLPWERVRTHYGERQTGGPLQAAPALTQPCLDRPVLKKEVAPALTEPVIALTVPARVAPSQALPSASSNCPAPQLTSL
jgi:hypothetical protein